MKTKIVSLHSRKKIVKKNIDSYFVLLLLPITIIGCTKFVEVPPPINQLSSTTAFADNSTADGTVIGIYSSMNGGPSLFTSNLTTLYAGMCSDELYNYTTDARTEFVNNEITKSNHNNLNTFFWNPAYRFIYAANSSIEGLEKSTLISSDVKKHLTGEVKFIRAFCYFYLINLFGDVPLITGTDYNFNATVPKIPKAQIVAQIIQDLKDAKDSLTTNVSAERIRPNRWSAMALLARVYLYDGQWKNATFSADEVIESGLYKMPANLNEVFLKNSTEAIWQLIPVATNQNTWEGNRTLPATASERPKYAVTPSLVAAFEPNDQRKTAWLKSRTYSGQTLYYPYKYKIVGNGAPVTEYYTVLRLTELYLIRAEARAQQDDLDGAITDIDRIRLRAGLGLLSTLTPSMSKQDILKAIEQERRVELFIEWGHRWFDLKRTNRADAIIGIAKPTTWQPSDKLWPIPEIQITTNPLLVQNEGY